jgi:Domain of unknown function (DUF397)
MSTNETTPWIKTPWIKASASDSNGTCVELRRHGASIEIRDSKHPDGPVLADFTSAELASFLDGARKGEFDHLI